MEQERKWNVDELLAYFDEMTRRVYQDARSRPRTVNIEQCKVLREVCDAATKIFGVEAEIKTYPVFTSGDVVVTVRVIEFGPEKISELKSALEHCTALSIAPLTNGCMEVGLTVPGVFNPAEEE